MGNIADGIKQYGTQQIQKDNAESDYLKTLVQDTSDFLSDFDDRVQNTVSDILPEVWVDPVETQTTPEEDDYLAHLRQQHPDATDSELRGKSVRNTFNKTEQSARSITGNIALGALNAVSTTDRVKGLDYDYIERASNPYTLDPALLSGSAAPNSEAIVARYEGLEKGDYESFSDEDKTFWNGPQAQLIRRIDANKKQHGEIKKSIEDYKTEADEYVIHTLQDYRNDEEFQKTYEEHGGGMEGLLHGLLNEAINDPAKMPVAFIENLPYMIGFAYGGAPVVATLASQKDEENVARFQEEKGRAPTIAERTRLLVDSVGSILMERFGDKYVLRGKAARAFRKINEVLPGVSRVVGGTVTEGISGGGSEAFDQDAIKQDVTKLDTFKIAKAAKEEALVGAGGGGIATVANNLESTAKYALEDEDRIPDTLRNMGVPIPEMKKQMIMGDKTLKSMPKPDLVQQSWRATAEDMDKKDVPMQEIWEKTGFMKKEDGKWRFEVDDAGAELTAEGLSVVKRRAHNANMHDYKLGNLLKHDKMYEVAPSLKDTRVRFYSGKSNSRGYYLSDNDTLYLNLNRFSAPTSGMVADDVIDLEERIENLKADPKSSDKAFPAGLKSWETNEKQVEELEKRLDKRRKAMRTRSDADLGVLLHEVQHAVQQREGFARGGSPTEFMAEITVEKMGEMYPDRDFSEESALEALNELPYEQRKELLEEIEKESQNRYHRLLGEQEANETGMTEKEGGRRGMTPEQLKETMPGEMGTNNTYWQEPIVKDAEGPRWKMDNTQPSSMWDDKIERRIKVMFPKDERGKYIPEERLTKEEYAEFQKAQHRLEVQARMDMEEEIALRIKDATEHEGAMQSIEYGGETITDPMFIQNEEHFKEKKKALLDIINNPSTDPTSFEKARNYLFKLEDKAEQLGYKIGKKQMSEDYRGSHTAPVPEGKNSLDDFSEAMPDSPNDPNFLRYYGMGGEYAAADAETLAAMKKAAGNPDAEITVYRATPNADKSINAGDWVSTSKKYAEQHGERYLEGGYDIAQRTVKASELHTDGDLHEWGYNPKETTTDDAYKADLVGEDVDFTNTSPKPTIQDSDIQVTGDSFTIENPDYSLSVIEKDDAMAVQWVRVNPDKRGAGIGTEMYELAIKDAKRRNLDLTSDDSVSESAMTIWKKLKDMGYKVNFNEEVYTQESDLGTTTITNNVGYPVVTLNTHGVLPSKSSKTPKVSLVSHLPKKDKSANIDKDNYDGTWSQGREASDGSVTYNVTKIPYKYQMQERKGLKPPYDLYVVGFNKKTKMNILLKVTEDGGEKYLSISPENLTKLLNDEHDTVKKLGRTRY